MKSFRITLLAMVLGASCCITLLGASWLAGCIGEPDTVAPVAVHELAGSGQTGGYDGQGVDDRICMLSTYNATKGWHHWWCNDDRVPVELDGTASPVANLHINSGNDIVVERWTNGPPGFGCNCTCNTLSSYGAQYDFRADLTANNHGGSVWIVDNGHQHDAEAGEVEGQNGVPYDCEDSGYDRVFGGRVKTVFLPGDGADDMSGGPYEDWLHWANVPTGFCDAGNNIQDPSGENWWLTGNGDDKIRDMQCNPGTVADCGGGAQDRYRCNSGEGNRCEIVDPAGPPVGLLCPSNFP